MLSLRVVPSFELSHVLCKENQIKSLKQKPIAIKYLETQDHWFSSFNWLQLKKIWNIIALTPCLKGSVRRMNFLSRVLTHGGATVKKALGRIGKCYISEDEAPPVELAQLTLRWADKSMRRVVQNMCPASVLMLFRIHFLWSLMQYFAICRESCQGVSKLLLHHLSVPFTHYPGGGEGWYFLFFFRICSFLKMFIFSQFVTSQV